VAGAPPNLLALEAYAKVIQSPPTARQPSVDFVAFLGPDQNCTGQAKCGGTVLGISAIDPDKKPTLDTSNLEDIILAGSSEVHNALQGHPTASVDDIGSVRSKLVVIGAAPVNEGPGNTGPVIGAVVVGKIVNTSLLQSLPLPGARGGSRWSAATESCSRAPCRERPSWCVPGRVRSSPKLWNRAGWSRTRRPWRTPVTTWRPSPSHAATGFGCGALLVSEQQTLAATQQQVATNIFLGALAATLFARGGGLDLRLPHHAAHP